MTPTQKPDCLFARTAWRALGAWVCLIAPPVLALAQDIDDRGRLIATPAESELIERGYLFYPHRALPVKEKTPANEPVQIGRAHV